VDGIGGRLGCWLEDTHRGDPAGGRDGAHGTRGLSEGVPEHGEGGDWEA